MGWLAGESERESRTQADMQVRAARQSSEPLAHVQRILRAKFDLRSTAHVPRRIIAGRAGGKLRTIGCVREMLRTVLSANLSSPRLPFAGARLAGCAPACIAAESTVAPQVWNNCRFQVASSAPVRNAQRKGILLSGPAKSTSGRPAPASVHADIGGHHFVGNMANPVRRQVKYPRLWCSRWRRACRPLVGRRVGLV